MLGSTHSQLKVRRGGLSAPLADSFATSQEGLRARESGKSPDWGQTVSVELSCLGWVCEKCLFDTFLRGEDTSGDHPRPVHFWA